VFATAAGYGLGGGWLLFQHVWAFDYGRAWTDTATLRLAWAVAVFLASTAWLARRSRAVPARWLALHAAGAFVAGAALTWGVLEYWMAGNEHGWDTDYDHIVASCFDCVPRAAIIRQTILATLVGSIAAAGLAPLVVRVAGRARGAEPA
jgi:hypothetical protein